MINLYLTSQNFIYFIYKFLDINYYKPTTQSNHILLMEAENSKIVAITRDCTHLSLKLPEAMVCIPLLYKRQNWCSCSASISRYVTGFCSNCKNLGCLQHCMKILKNAFFVILGVIDDADFNGGSLTVLRLQFREIFYLATSCNNLQYLQQFSNFAYSRPPELISDEGNTLFLVVSKIWALKLLCAWVFLSIYMQCASPGLV